MGRKAEILFVRVRLVFQVRPSCADSRRDSAPGWARRDSEGLGPNAVLPWVSRPRVLACSYAPSGGCFLGFERPRSLLHIPIIDDLVFLTWLSCGERVGGPGEVEGTAQSEAGDPGAQAAR